MCYYNDSYYKVYIYIYILSVSTLLMSTQKLTMDYKSIKHENILLHLYQICALVFNVQSTRFS